MAAKRYRGEEHRSFHRSAAYTEGRRTRNSRDARALAKKTAYGRAVAAGQWAGAEWESLKRLWSLGLPVPYPVQLDGTELLMEWITHDGESAPRLAQTRPAPDLLECYFDQLRDALAELARHGIVHGDLSPYNILAAGERLVDHRPAAGGRPGGQPGRAGLPAARLHATCAPGSAPAASRSTSTTCSGSCWRRRTELR